MRELLSVIMSIIALPFLLVLSSCEHKTSAWGSMDLAENLMTSHPDSAYTVLSSIDKNKLGENEEKARYALLMSMALDKNYIDTTTFDVLQPAIDHYLKRGTADDKLRTLYYQGRIFLNQGKDDFALASFMKATELKNLISDSLLLAHAFVAIGTIDLKQYKIDQFIKRNLDAAKLYDGIDRNDFAAKSYSNALGGYVMLKDKFMSDSILSICHKMAHLMPEASVFIYPAYTSYIVEYGSHEDLESLFSKFKNDELSSEDRLEFARGYSRLGEYDKASSILSEYTPSGSLVDSLKYLSIETNILAKRGDFEKAFGLYEKYSSLMERYQHYLMSNDLLFAEERHKIEVENLKTLQNRDRIIWMSLCGIFVMIIFIGWLFYRYRLIQSKRILVEKDNANLKLEQENLLLEKTRLEGERDNLNELLNEQSGLTQSLRQIVKTRLSMLNSLLAKEITKEESYAKPYRKWVDSIRKDKEEFKNSTREAFSVSHPKFMKYLVSHELTLDEINYVCLYAIGLRGKDVGEYINLKRHYNVSSEIRKKLGIDKHETNLSLYIRQKMDELDSQ